MNKFTLALILLLSFFRTQAATLISTPVFQKSSYITYEKAEASFTIEFNGGNYSNPFDSSVVSVDALVTLPDNSTIMVPCFYFIPASFASAGINWWDGSENSAGAKWLLRYTPKSGGPYSISIRVIDANGTVTSSPVSFFAAAISVGGPKGFVHTDPSNNQFMRFENGSPYYPIGENLAWQTPGTLVQFYNTYLENLGNNKATWIRYWLTGFSRQALEWKLTWSDWYDGGLGKYSQRAAALLDSVVYNCERKDIYIQLVLQQHGQFSTVVDSNWPDNPYNSANPGGFLSNPCEFFTNTSAIAQTKKQYRYIVARWGYSSHILAWELFNEVHFAGSGTGSLSPCTPSDVVSWHNTMCNYLKSIDVNQHLVTTSADNNLLTLMDGANTNLDNLQYHTYTNAPIEQTMVANAVAAKNAFTKPVLCGEFGISNTTVSSVAGDLWADHIRKPMWTGLFNEVPAMYWYWDSTYMQRKSLYNVFNPISTFLEGVDIVGETGGHSEYIKFALNPSLTSNLSAVPGLSWATSTQKDFIVDGSGAISGLDKLSSYLQGPWNSALGTYASFTVNYANAGTATINVSGVSTAAGAGSATVTIFVDGVSKASGNFSTAGALVAQVPAGTHTIRFERTTGGNDWVNVSNYSFTPVAIEKCLAYGYHGAYKAYGYVFDKSLPQWQNPSTATAISTAQIRIGSLTAGNYRVEYFDPQEGISFIPGDVYETLNDSITISLPSFKKDLAYKVYFTTDPVTSVFDRHQSNTSSRISLYPNPAYNEINIKVSSPGESQSRLSILNIIGKEVIAQDIILLQGSNVFNLDISSLPPSLYFVRLTHAGKVNGSLKFIKQ